jgi:hypothetical protein
VEGTIRDVRRVASGRAGERTIVARVETRDGRVARVNLGPESRFDEAELREGEQVTLHGTEGTFQGRPVLMVSRAEIAGRQIDIQRGVPEDRAAAARP